MNLRELSELVQVTVHLKNVINSAGYTKFNNNTITTLKKRMAELDELFISEMLNYEIKSDAKVIHDAVQEARQKMGLDQSYPSSSKLITDAELKSFRNMSADERIKAGEALNKKVAEKKSTSRKNAKSVEKDMADIADPYMMAVASPSEELKKTDSQLVDVAKKEEVKELPKTTPNPLSSQPYMEDQSLATLLAAERQKVAAKKRKL